MKRNDTRKLDHKTLEAIRIRAVKQVQAGQSPEVVIRASGFSIACIYKWLAAYQCGGWHELRAQPLLGRPPHLNGRQLKWIYDAVTLMNPFQYRFEFAVWIRRMIQMLIRDGFGIRLSLASVGRLVARLGLTCPKPLMRAFQQNPALLETWLKEGYVQIRGGAKRIHAEILFGDEAGVWSDFPSGKTWPPKGRLPC